MIISLKKNPINRLWVLALIAILLGMLYFGLRPKGYDFNNHIEWLEDRPGIHISRYGLAYTKLDSQEGAQMIGEDVRFSMEMAFQADAYEEEGFHFIVSMHNGKDQDQLLVGQWGATIIVMRGDDFDHTRRDPRISAKISSQGDEATLLMLTTGKEGTRMYVNGRHIKTNPGLKLQIPPGPSVWLTLGDSVYAKHSWSGNMFGLAIYDQTISAQKAQTHFQRWKAEESLLFAKVENPVHLYLFDENQGQIIIDHGKGNQDLELPARIRVLKKQLLSLPWKHFKPDRHLFSDIIINLLGFVPLGFVLSLVLGGSIKLSDAMALMTTIAVCLVFSLSIEIAQAWLPSRSSSLLDWVLNMSGGGLGALIALKWHIKS
jgi:VanZ family protein